MIECWNIRLLGYEGKYNPSDYLSLHVIAEQERKYSLAEEYVCFLSTNAVPKAMTLEEIQQATIEDNSFYCVAWLIRNQK